MRTSHRSKPQLVCLESGDVVKVLPFEPGSPRLMRVLLIRPSAYAPEDRRLVELLTPERRRQAVREILEV